jgi:hypothetical protein
MVRNLGVRCDVNNCIPQALISGNNVVLAGLPNYETSALLLQLVFISRMRQNFQNSWYGLIVVIRAGVPGRDRIRNVKLESAMLWLPTQKMIVKG